MDGLPGMLEGGLLHSMAEEARYNDGGKWWEEARCRLQGLLLRCGDVHPHPGPGLRVMSANVTSLRKHWDQLLERKEEEVLCLQETRLTEQGQRAMGAIAGEKG